MREELVIDETEVYEAPVLVEVGEYAELTEGAFGHRWDGFGGFHWWG
ncbi:lasso RiPP family leader peptide-containing protein [Streptomyces sp. NPDC006307]